MRRLAAQHLLPGEGDDIELVPGQVLREGRARSRRRSSGPRGRPGSQSPFGTRTPLVVPFQVKTTSRSKSTVREIDELAVGRFLRTSASSFSCLTTSVTQPAPKLSQASMSGRARRASTTSPSRRRRCPRPARCRCGSRRHAEDLARHLDGGLQLGLADSGAVRPAERLRETPKATCSIRSVRRIAPSFVPPSARSTNRSDLRTRGHARYACGALHWRAPARLVSNNRATGGAAWASGSSGSTVAARSPTSSGDAPTAHS
jgi:hypothetical protein